MLKQGQVALVLYSDIVAAFYAQIALNNVPLRSKNSQLEVNWYELEDEALFDESEEVKESDSSWLARKLACSFNYR